MATKQSGVVGHPFTTYHIGECGDLRVTVSQLAGGTKMATALGLIACGQDETEALRNLSVEFADVVRALANLSTYVDDGSLSPESEAKPQTIERDKYAKVWTTTERKARMFFGVGDHAEVVVLKLKPTTNEEKQKYRPEAKLYGVRTDGASSYGPQSTIGVRVSGQPKPGRPKGCTCISGAEGQSCTLDCKAPVWGKR